MMISVVGRARGDPIPNMAATGAPLIRGTVREGQELTVDTSGIADRNGLGNVPPATFTNGFGCRAVSEQIFRGP